MINEIPQTLKKIGKFIDEADFTKESVIELVDRYIC